MEGGPNPFDSKYVDLIVSGVRVCARYQPKFGQGTKAFSLSEFQALYGADPFYSWFGLDSPLMYAAHKAAGGMTSVYRQIGKACERVFNHVLRDHLGLTEEQANWSYSLPPAAVGGKIRALSLDGRIAIADVKVEARSRVAAWMNQAAAHIQLSNETLQNLHGAVFEVRQGYKSKDSKRQNADVANAANAYAALYLPVVTLLSTQIDGDVARRYAAARWLILTGTTAGSPVTSTYVFSRDVIGFDLSSFFQRHRDTFRREVEQVLKALLGTS